MGPHLATLAETSSGLVNDECDTKILGQTTQSLVEEGCSLSILISSDGLNNYGCDVFVLGLSLLDQLFGLSKATCLFFVVLLFKVGKWILQLW